MNKEEIEHMWKVASNNPNHDTNWHDPVVIRFAELVASTAIKEALAQTEQDWTPERIAGMARLKEAQDKKLAQPEQEPVGWAEHGVINWLADKQFNHTSFLYDTPAQRTWVGLTKEERHEISMANRPYCADVMAAHEEELKRRNT